MSAHIVTLCTGNAARSVMAGYILEHLADERGLHLTVATRGTHVIDGQPMSHRTRTALTSLSEMAHAPVGHHRSRQLHREDADAADLIVGMEADHVRFVRRHHPDAADRTVTLRTLAAQLEPGTAPLEALPARVGRLGLAQVLLDDREDVVDPAGRTDEFYVACAHEIWALCQELAPRL
jgi:protein-tyrosine-phosphatase